MSNKDAKLAVVIGGGNGIGAACCRLMHNRGWRVAVVDIDKKMAEAVANEFGGYPYAVDISDLAALENLAAEVEGEHGPVSSLVVCAAIFQERSAPEDISIELVKKSLDINIAGTFYANRVFGTLMAKRGGGSIVNIGSTAAHNSQPLYIYGPTKAAVLNMTKSLAVQWGKSGVRVNSVSPGATLVPRVLARPPGRYSVNIDEQMALGRRIQPEEIAEGVEFLASDRASAITGIDLLIDAGMISAGGWTIYGGPPASKQDGEAA